MPADGRWDLNRRLKDQSPTVLKHVGFTTRFSPTFGIKDESLYYYIYENNRIYFHGFQDSLVFQESKVCVRLYI